MDQVTTTRFRDEHSEERRRAVDALMAECPRWGNEPVPLPIVSAAVAQKAGPMPNGRVRGDHESGRRLRHLTDGALIFCIRENVSFPPKTPSTTRTLESTDAQASLDLIPAKIPIP